MDLDEVERVTRQALRSAIDFSEQTLAPQRTKAIEYYQEYMRDLPHDEGRSGYISTEVRDIILAQMPSLLRLFFSDDNPIEFVPRGPEDVEAAAQATEYVNFVLTQDNPGFRVFWSWFLDALLTSKGTVKWWWEEVRESEPFQVSGILPQQMAKLANDPSLQYQVTNIEPVQVEGMQIPVYSVEGTRLNTTGRFRFQCIPPEDWFRDAESEDIEDGAFCAHRVWVTNSDLLKMGYTAEQVEEASSSDAYIASDEAIARVGTSDSWRSNTERNRRAYYECYLPLDPKGLGLATLHKVCLLGDNAGMLGEPVQVRDVPVAELIPLPQPHTSLGMGSADITMPQQRLKTGLMRGMLDSLASALNPETEFVEGQVNVADLLNKEWGKIIRTAQPGMITRTSHNFVGREVLAVAAYADQTTERKTGIVAGAAGLDMDALQSTTKSAADAAVQSSEQMQQMIALMFAQTGVKRLMKGCLRTLIEHQDAARMVRLRNTFVAVDPRSWNATMDLQVNVAIGRSKQEKVQTLLGVLAQQKEILMSMGPQNALTSLGLIGNTLDKLTELGGNKDVRSYWKQVDDAALEKAAAEAPPPPPSPETILAQAQLEIEKMKVEKEFTIKQAELAFKAKELEFAYQKEGASHAVAKESNDITRDKNETDAILSAEEIRLKYQTTLDQAVLSETAAHQREKFKADHAKDSESSKQSHERQLHGVEPVKREPEKPKKITVERGPDGRIAGATITPEGD